MSVVVVVVVNTTVVKLLTAVCLGWFAPAPSVPCLPA